MSYSRLKQPKSWLSWVWLVSGMAALILNSSGCATHNQTIAGGMLAGAMVGASVGYQFVHHGEDRKFETENTITTAILFSLITGGILAWHYHEIREAKVEVSGRYARYRLCDPEELQLELSRRLELGDKDTGTVCQLDGKQIGDSAISLDDQTKWVYPSFRKRYLQPDRQTDQVISRRYIWEIIKPGEFVTRSQNPQYFSQQETNYSPLKEPGDSQPATKDSADKEKENETTD